MGKLLGAGKVSFSFADNKAETVQALTRRSPELDRSRTAHNLLLLSTALTSTLVLSSVLVAPPAKAADECGPLAASISCTASTGIGNPYPNGIAYDPLGSFTLIVDPTVVIDTTGSGFNGISIPTPGNPLPNGDIIVNVATGASITADKYGVSVYVDSGSVTIDNGAAIDAGYGGILAVNYGAAGAITITNSGAINAAYSTLFTFSTGDFSTVSITNTGALNAGTNGIGVIAAGNAVSVKIDNEGAIQAGFVGAGATTDGANSGITITNRGAIAADSFGIATRTFGAGSDATVVNSGDIAAGVHGFFLRSYALGADADSNITLTNSGAITAAADGIRALSYGGGSDITIVNSGAVSAGYNAIFAQAEGSGANVTITNSGDLTGGGLNPVNNYIGGINVVTSGDASSIDINNSGKLNSVYGVVAVLNGANSSVNLVSSGDINAIYAGITTLAYGDNTQTVVANSGKIVSVYAGAQGFSAGDFSNVTVINSGDIVSTITGSPVGRGLGARTNGDFSDVQIVNSGTITAANYGISTRTEGQGSDLGVINSGDIVAGGIGINARTYGTGTLVISNSGTLQGGTGGISAFSNIGTAIANAGSIATDSGPVIDTGGAATNVTNFGLITGFIDLTDNGDAFANNAGAVFEARATSDFGGGDDAFDNFGTVHTAGDPGVAEATAFINLENFNNHGLVSLIDGGTGDSFTLSGNFNAGSGALGLDAFLGGAGASPTDRFIVQGNVTGQTALVINNTNLNGGVLNTVGVDQFIFVDGALDANSFVLANGPVEAGFFSYDLFFDPAAKRFDLRSFVDADGHILPQLLTATQDIWNITSDSWFDRTADLRQQLRGDAPVSLKDSSLLAAGPAMPAVWARTSGEWLSRDADATTSAYGRTYDFSLDRDLQVADFQAGIDFGTRNVVEQGDALIFGLTGGAIVANLDYNNVGREFDITGGQAGAYVTYLNRNLFIDALVKADFLDIDDKSGPLPGSVDARTVGIRVDGGYRFQAPGMFVEPLATLAATWSDIASFTQAENDVEFGDDVNVRGRLGLRIGTTLTPWTGVKMEPFLIGSFWSELEGGNTARLTSTGTTFAFEDDHADSWGEVSAGINWFDAANSTTAFTKVDVTFGDDIEGVGGQVGVRIKW